MTVPRGDLDRGSKRIWSRPSAAIRQCGVGSRLGAARVRPVGPLIDHALTIRARGPRVGDPKVRGSKQGAAAETAMDRERCDHRSPIPHERVFERLPSVERV